MLSDEYNKCNIKLYTSIVYEEVDILCLCVRSIHNYQGNLGLYIKYYNIRKLTNIY